MKKIIVTLFLSVSFPISAHAEWIIDVFNKLTQIYGLNLDMKNIDQAQLNKMSQLNNINQSQLNQLTKLTDGLTGTHQYGNQLYNPNRFNWGQGSQDWRSILYQADHGGNSSELGNIIKQISGEFPIKNSLGSSNDLENQYYRMQAQTTIASRASAELAFDQLNQEEKTMQQLHQLIDKTNDNKSSVDLNNRLSAETAMINLQQAKLLAILVQQTAIDSQQHANRAKENADFFDIK